MGWRIVVYNNLTTADQLSQTMMELSPAKTNKDGTQNPRGRKDSKNIKDFLH